MKTKRQFENYLQDMFGGVFGMYTWDEIENVQYGECKIVEKGILMGLKGGTWQMFSCEGFKENGTGGGTPEQWLEVCEEFFD